MHLIAGAKQLRDESVAKAHFHNSWIIVLSRS